MSSQPKIVPLPAMVPVNDETRAMLDYAASADGRAKIEKARQEIRDGKGILVSADYFEKMNERISRRAALSREA